MAKTDGRIVVRLAGRAAPGGHRRHRELRRASSPTGGCLRRRYAEELLLVGDHVAAEHRRAADDGPSRAASPLRPGEHRGRTTSTSPTPRTPARGPDARWSGRQLSLRQYGDTVRLVTTHRAARRCRFVQPRPGGLSEQPGHAQEPRDRALASSIRGAGSPGLVLRRGLPPGEVVGARDGRGDDLPPGRRLAEPPGRRHRVPATRSTPRRTGSTSPPPTGAGRTACSRRRRTRSPVSIPFASADPPHPGPRVRARRGHTRYVASGAVDGTGPRPLVARRAGRPPPGRRLLAGPARRSATDNGVVVLDERGGRLVQVG